MSKNNQGNRPVISGKNIAASTKRLISYMARYFPVQMILVVVFILISAAAGVIGSVFIGILIDDYISPLSQSANPDFGPLGVAIMIMVAIYVVGIICTYLYQVMMAVLGQGVLKKIRDELFNHMQTLPVAFFDTRTRGDIMSVYTNDVDTLREFISRSLPMVVQNIVTMIAVLVAMFIYNWFLALLVVGFSIVIVFITQLIARKAAKYFMRQQVALGETNGYIEEMIGGQRVIKVFNHEKAAEEGFDEHNEELAVDSKKANAFANILMPIVGNIGNLQYVVIAVLGGLALVNGFGGVTIGMIISFLSLSKAFTNPIGQLSQQINIVAMALSGAKRIFDLIDEPSETDSGYVELVNAKADADGNPLETPERTNRWAWKHPHQDGSPTTYVWVRGKITFNDVDFAYVPGKTILHGITLYAEPGQKVAFVGPTGAGKTTITNLINRFYDIEDGKIRFDDININKIKKSALRRSLGMVLQETDLFTGTVRENIRFGNIDATDEQVEEAAKLANADNFIRMLPQGYDTVLTSGGNDLSQGQRQLISIARAAVANPPVMILDEATSSIDTRTESLVQHGMDAIMEGRTVFVIAHRLSTVQNSNVIMVLENGSITERGTHEQLLAKKGKYYQLYTGNAPTAA